MTAHDELLYKQEIQKLAKTTERAIDRMLAAKSVVEAARRHAGTDLRLKMALDEYDAGEPS